MLPISHVQVVPGYAHKLKCANHSGKTSEEYGTLVIGLSG